MNSREAAIFITILIAVLALILVVLYLRYRNLQMYHRERMAALEKGTAVPVGHTLAPWSARVYLLRGLLWSFAGAALIACLLGIAGSTHRPESIQATMWRAKSLSDTLNISAEEARKMAETERDTRPSGMPFSVALLGLIPLGVGLAYLVFYYTGRSQGPDHA